MVLVFLLGLAGVGLVDTLSKRELMVGEKKRELARLVEVAHSVLRRYEDLHRAGHLTLAEAQLQAKGVIRALRYDTSEYFWINDKTQPFPRMVLHPLNPGLEGKILDGDELGFAQSFEHGQSGKVTYLTSPRKLFSVFNEVVQQSGHGYVTYLWQKPLAWGGQTDERFSKLSYVREFTPWGWVLGSGRYMDDVDQAVDAQIARNLELMLVVAIPVVVLAFFLALNITRPLGRAKRQIKAMIDGTRELAPLPIEREDEIGTLISGFNELEQKLQAKELDLKRELFFRQTVFEQNGLLAGILDSQGRLIEVNAAALAILGCDAEEVLGKYFPETPWWVRQEDRVLLERVLYEAFSGRTDSFEAVHLTVSGAEMTVIFRAQPIYVGDEVFVAVTGVDITERKKSDETLRRAASVFSHAREGIMVTDTRGLIVDTNPAFTRITGYERHEVIGKTPSMLSSGRQKPEYYAELWGQLLKTGHWTGEIWNRRKNGEVYAELLSISVVRDAHGNGQNFIALFSDITPQKEYQHQLERIAHYDILTGLPNRMLLVDRLHQAMVQVERRQSSVGVVYIDLDGFKAINDTHGHDVGDFLLITVAERMRMALRESDTIARIGGDEFVAVLLDLAGPEDARALLDRLLAAAAAPVYKDGLCLGVSASIGISLYPQKMPIDTQSLLKQADQAMYQAKHSGKNQYHFFDA